MMDNAILPSLPRPSHLRAHERHDFENSVRSRDSYKAFQDTEKSLLLMLIDDSETFFYFLP